MKRLQITSMPVSVYYIVAAVVAIAIGWIVYDKPVKKLSWDKSPIPEFGLNFYTDGQYPIFSGAAGLNKPNEAIKKLFLQSEEQSRTAAKDILQRAGKTVDDIDPKSAQYNGYRYVIYLGKSTISASSKIISVLAPTILAAGGVNNESWLSETLTVPSASTIELVDLFNEPREAMKAIRSIVIKANPCDLSRKEREKYFESGFSAALSIDKSKTTKHTTAYTTPVAYRHFALTPQGLHIGFDRYQIGYGVCGGPSVTISWPELSSYLNDNGKEIIKKLQ